MNSFVHIHRGAARVLAAGALLLAATAHGDVVFDWNEALRRFSTASVALDAHVEARAYAMTHLAMDEAIVAAAREPAALRDAALPTAAAIAAAHTILTRVLPDGTPRFDALAAAQLAAIPESAARQRGAALGARIAAEVLGKREGDNWTQLAADDLQRDRGGPTELDRLLREGPARSPWNRLKPFVLKKADQAEAPSLHWVALDGELLVVQGLARSRIFDGVDRSALDELSGFWSERPVVAWNRVGRVVSETAGHDLATRARLFAALNLALADAALSACHWQFTLGTWRREFRDGLAAIESAEEHFAQQSGSVGIDRVRFGARQIMIPPVPNYPALPAALAAAAQVTFAQFCRADQMSLRVPVPPGVRGGAREFAGIAVAARECAFAASLNSRYSRESCVAGYMLGESVGRHVMKKLGSARR